MQSDLPARAEPTSADAGAARKRGARVADLWLGQQLRGLRQMRELSISEIAGRAGLSVGAVSQIERGLSSPSVRSLRRLADVLGVPMTELFHQDGDFPPAEELGRVVRARSRRILRLTDNGVTKELLSPATPGGLEMLLVTIAPGGSSGAEPYTHRGEEGGYVIEGAMRLWVEADAFVLTAGDSFRFPSTVPHKFASASDGPTTVLWTIWNGG